MQRCQFKHIINQLYWYICRDHKIISRYNEKISHYHDISCYHKIISCYHEIMSCYHDIFIFGKKNIACPKCTTVGYEEIYICFKWGKCLKIFSRNHWAQKVLLLWWFYFYFQHWTFTHIMQSCKQDWFAVASILEHTLVTMKSQLPHINEVYLRSDNAGCYHCANLWLSIPGISDRTGKV